MAESVGPPVVVLIGTVLAFVLGGGYYAVLADRLPRPVEAVPRWTYLVELLRCMVLATVVIGLATVSDVDSWWAGLLLGLVLWVAFPLVLWTGAVLHERTPVATAVLHGGDWLVKLLALGLLAGLR